MKYTTKYRKSGIWSQLGDLFENLAQKLHAYQSEQDYRRYSRQNRRTAYELERRGCL